MNTDYDSHTGRRNKEANIGFYKPVIWLWGVTLVTVAVLSFFAYRWNFAGPEVALNHDRRDAKKVSIQDSSSPSSENRSH
jgi:hypothetical protein